MAVEAVQFKVSTNLGAIIVMPTLFGFRIEPKTRLPQVDVRQAIDVFVDLTLQVFRQSLPQFVLVIAIKVRVPDERTTGPAGITIQDWQHVRQKCLSSFSHPSRLSAAREEFWD